jgi:hypothetical protein
MGYMSSATTEGEAEWHRKANICLKWNQRWYIAGKVKFTISHHMVLSFFLSFPILVFQFFCFSLWLPEICIIWGKKKVHILY